MTMNEHVFKVVDNGDIVEIVGDFEGLYKSENEYDFKIVDNGDIVEIIGDFEGLYSSNKKSVGEYT